MINMFPFNMCPIPINTLELETIETHILKSKIEELEKEHYKMMYDTLNKQKQIIDKAIEFNQIILDSDYVYSQDEIATKNLEILGDKEDE